ncbi:HSF-type DNA-binding-domain-containing protein [Gongronella butleri]|nr:HSF-type DNA-binding-domain-containing protein [Gongronella butleri]
MDHGRSSSLSSVSAMNDTISAGSPLSSPSPTSKDSPMDTRVSDTPPAPKPSSNTFVHKLFNMVIDNQYQHLIAWSYTGHSFIVCNIVEFSHDVLPKHFKHNNFSSFVRQLNMYGFHKVNKSPRGHRTVAENQIWEFSHPKFIRDRPDLLDEIKRRAMDDNTRKETQQDLQSQLSMVQMAQADLVQQFSRLQEQFEVVVRELSDTKKRQTEQQEMIKTVMQFVKGPCQESMMLQPSRPSASPTPPVQRDDQMPAILITSPDVQHTTMNIPTVPSMSSPSVPSQHAYNTHQHAHHHHHHAPPNDDPMNYTKATSAPRRTPPLLTVQTQNLSPSPMFLSDGRSPVSPCSAYHTPLSSTPVSPHNLMPDDGLYSPMHGAIASSSASSSSASIGTPTISPHHVVMPHTADPAFLSEYDPGLFQHPIPTNSPHLHP